MAHMSQRDDLLLQRLREAALTLREVRAERDTLEQERSEPIAVVGIGCRFPGGAHTPEAFWELLDTGRDAIQSLDARWELVGLKPSDEIPLWAGLLTGSVDGFDAAFFDISPREARSLDPQQRLLLEVAWEAIENAGIPPASSTGPARASSSAPAPPTTRRAPSRSRKSMTPIASRATCSASLLDACRTRWGSRGPV